MDGLAAARILRDGNPGIHIVFVTAFDKFDYAREALRLGVDEYLVKPASADEVLSMARRVLDRVERERLGPGASSDGALSLLEEELRADLGRDPDRDPGRDAEIQERLAAFLRLRGCEGRIAAALVLRPAGPAVQEPGPFPRRPIGRGTRELLERRLREAGWYALAGERESELRCLAVAPSAGGAGTEAEEALRTVLSALTEELRRSLGIRVLTGACLLPDGSPRFRQARQAAALARIDRPVVVLDSDPDGRLRPEEADGPGSGAVERAVGYLREHLAEDLSLVDVARAVGTAPSHLSRLFRRHRGETFVQVFCRIRIDAAKRLLRTGAYRVKEAASLVGFKDTAYFCRVFRKYEGASPSEFQAGSG
jgi:two-component system response regulator YesN